MLVIANKVDSLLEEEKENLMAFFNRSLSNYIVQGQRWCKR